MLGKKTIHIRNNEEIEIIRKSSLLVGATLAEVAKIIRPGITTKELDARAEEFIRDQGALPGFKGYRGFPATLCVSINEEVVHGIPGPRILKDGDIVSVDCGVVWNGYYGDSAYTFGVGVVDPKCSLLMSVTKRCLELGIAQAIEGNRIGDIGYEVQNYAESNGFSIVRDLVGHGVGKNLHEEPEVPNYGKRGRGIKLMEGMVLAIEPMINMGKREVRQLKDGWTIITSDKQPSAHFEHNVVVRKGKVELLSSFELIEEVINKN